jgi:WD40 repeat protein
LVATQDAKLLCTDISGTLVAALQCDSAVLCLGSVQGDGALVLGGCADGSVRLWSLTAAGGKLREVQRWSKAHSGPVTALALAGVPQSDLPCEMMVTGSEDCSVKVWRLAFDR